MELCFNEMTVMKNGALPEDIALCAQAGFSAVELRKGTLLRYLRGGGTLEALRQGLPLLRDAGMQVTTVSDLFAVRGYGMENGKRYSRLPE